MEGNASYNAIDGSITFVNSVSINAQNLIHETTHMAQNHFYNNALINIMNSTDYKGYSNIEFELRIISDIKTSGWTPITSDPVVNIDYMDFIMDIQSNGIPADFNEKFFYFIEYWKVSYPEYNKPTDLNLLPDFINSLNVTCNDTNL